MVHDWGFRSRRFRVWAERCVRGFLVYRLRSEPGSNGMRKWLIVTGISLALAVGIVYGMRGSLKSLVRARTENILRTHFASEVEFADFDVTLFPRACLTVDQLVLRHRGRTDVPPLIKIRKMSIYASLRGLLRAEPRIALVELEGLEIRTPPRKAGAEPLIHGTELDLEKKYPAIIEKIHADDAVIYMLRKEPEKPPRTFQIHHLELHHVSFDRPASFEATLTNYLPIGEIATAGEFGPWDAEEPSETPVDGRYTFKNADLGTIKGIRGILSSDGTFHGPLDYLEVEGTTDIPDFSLRKTAHPMALHTKFSAVVDGTNGNTYLNLVTARFLQSSLAVNGKVVDMDPEVKGRTILLEAVSQDARVEDLIRLAVKTDEPVLTGSTRLRAKIAIPEGDAELSKRLRLQGQFAIAGGQFSSPKIQGKVDTLSRKAQGQPKDMDITKVSSEMSGRFGLKDDVMTFSNLSFDVSGAAISLSGSYRLDGGELDFHGKLVMQAKLSQTMTGAKSFFLKALDPFFKGKNAGTVLPIKITGTKDKPVFGLDRGGTAGKDSPPPSAAKTSGR